ncbi:hypothetical protein JCM11491_002766 [Sporobolomyces phaffii]
MYSRAPLPVIIDTDPGVDDVIALLLALTVPDLVVVGLTLTHGNCSLESTEKNLAKMFYAIERHAEAHPESERWSRLFDRERRRTSAGPGAETIRVWRGSSGPIHGPPVTAKYFHGQDGLANCETLYPELTPPPSYRSNLYTLCPESAQEGITRLVSSWPPGHRKPSYIALGPLTSLAQLSTSLNLGQSFETILSMGGAVEHAGNTTPVAEFNYYADPWAARTVFSLALPNLYIFPLDLTSYLTLPFSLYESAVDPTFSSRRDRCSHPSESSDDPLVRFTTSFLRGTRDVMETFGGDAMELHDPTVVFALIERSRSVNGCYDEAEQVDYLRPPNGRKGTFATDWEWRQVDFDVECDGTLTRGMLVVDRRASATAPASITNRTGETNRAVAVAALDVAEVEARHAELRDDDDATDKPRPRCGARVVVTSPGSDVMRNELLKRVWGVASKWTCY